MDTLHAIMTRRSIRHYTPQPVSDELLESLLRAAMQAPSAGNSQPWYFVVIRDRQVLDTIPTFHPFSEMLKEAPLAIVMCAQERPNYPEYWIQDCAASIQNILLAAHAQGLGAVWLGVHPRPDRAASVSKLLGLPDEIHPLGIVSIGYPAEEKPPIDRFSPDRIHYNRW
jgi:nitroreductase